VLRGLVEKSVRFRGVVIALACLVVGYGLRVARHAKLDVFPEFAPPQAVIQTEAPGLSPEEVEQLVTRPVEAALSGAGDLDSIRSQSIQGLSVVTAVFREGTDILRARQMASERLAEAASRMPKGVEPPTLAPLTSATSIVLAIGLTSKTGSAMELRDFAEWTMEPRLLGVPGVAKVAIFGGDVRQLQVQLLPDRLAALHVAIGDVVAAAQEATGVRGAGFVETDAQRIVIRTQGQAVGPDDLAESIVRKDARGTVRLRDVAKVAFGAAPRLGDAQIGGKRGVELVLSSQFGANTVDVTEAAEHAIEEMRPAIEEAGIELHPALFRPANFISRAVRNVDASLLLGGALVTITLFLFLWNVRAALISLTAIPLSLLTAVILLDRLGVTLNTLTLGGLAIAIGEVVDDAIIDVENIFRRLRENRAAGQPKSSFRVVVDASVEVRSAVVYATFVVALVFLPVLMMTGIQGRLFAPLGVAYILAILASLVVALTLTPALTAALLFRARLPEAEPRFVAWLKDRYRGLLGRVSRHPRGVILGAALLCVAAAATLPFFGGAFLPELSEGHFILHMSAVPGTSVDESLRVGARVMAELSRNPHIRSIAQRVGRAEKGDDVLGVHETEFDVDLVPLEGDEAEGVQSEMRETLARFPGVAFAITPFLTERIEETMTGVTAEVVVKIYGDDLDVLDERAAEVARVLGEIDGAVDVRVESPPGLPQIVVRLRRDDLRRFGIAPLDALESVQTAYQGADVAQTYEGSRVTDVVAILDPGARRDPEAIGALLLTGAGGLRVPLSAVADVDGTRGRYLILHEGSRRRQAVSCNVRGRDLAGFVAEAQRRIARDVKLPAGVYATFGGAAEAKSAASRELLVHSVVASVGIVLLLALAFGSGRNLALVLANLPFALVGGVLAVFFTGGWLSVGSLVGFVTLFGITTRNSIMMVSHFEHLVREEGAPWGEGTAIRGATERLVPVLMTALVTALGLLPLALGSGDPGREIEGPMAIVILGGLATSTVLNLLVLPTLALRHGDFALRSDAGA
jgi:CzcA family heavy metal efflux pump